MLAEACRRSLYRFLLEFLPEIEPSADKFVWNFHIKYLCDAFQKIVFNYRDGKPTQNLNLNICPGATKSTVFSRVATAWIWTIFPQATTINVTRDSNNVKNFALKCKEIIVSEKYKALFPEIEIKKEPDSMFYFENNFGGVRYGLTTKASGSTGKHADFIIFDDAYAYSDLESPATVKSLETSIEGYLSRFKDKSKGVVINVMQRLGVNDPTAFLFEGYLETKPKLKNYQNICMPAIVNDMLDPPELKDKYIDGLLDPIRLSHEILEQEKLKYGYKYDAQYNQDPLLDKEGLMYPELNMYDYDTPDGGIKFTFLDPADKGDDFLACWFCKIVDNKIYVYDCIYSKEGSGVTIPTLKVRLSANNSAVNWAESNSIGSVFISQLEGFIPNFQGVYENTNKVQRIFAYSYYTKFLNFASSGSAEYMLAVQHLKRIPKTIPNGGKGMDIDGADALTSMIRYFYTHFPQLFLIN